MQSCWCLDSRDLHFTAILSVCSTARWQIFLFGYLQNLTNFALLQTTNIQPMVWSILLLNAALELELLKDG